MAEREDRILISKDADFRDGHLLRGIPRRLLVVASGNISNALLELVAAGSALGMGGSPAVPAVMPTADAWAAPTSKRFR